MATHDHVNIGNFPGKMLKCENGQISQVSINGLIVSLLSIIIPSYNQFEGLKRTVNSVKEIDDLEVVVLTEGLTTDPLNGF